MFRVIGIPRGKNARKWRIKPRWMKRHPILHFLHTFLEATTSPNQTLPNQQGDWLAAIRKAKGGKESRSSLGRNWRKKGKSEGQTAAGVSRKMNRTNRIPQGGHFFSTFPSQPTIWFWHPFALRVGNVKWWHSCVCAREKTWTIYCCRRKGGEEKSPPHRHSVL